MLRRPEMGSLKTLLVEVDPKGCNNNHLLSSHDDVLRSFVFSMFINTSTSFQLKKAPKINLNRYHVISYLPLRNWKYSLFILAVATPQIANPAFSWRKIFQLYSNCCWSPICCQKIVPLYINRKLILTRVKSNIINSFHKINCTTCTSFLLNYSQYNQ